ncbi:MAG: GNAT family N-acetyltransferase [Desulfobacterales bacterium]|nr:MAG: GNAT family N-acetyltransferase [Desulfobacterales bacterium]
MIRKAQITDVPSIHRLLQTYARKGELLGRPLSKLYDHLRDFWVYADPETGSIAGCCALQFCWENLAEVRSLAVDEHFSGQGIGSLLTRKVIQEARDFHITDLFTLTYRPGFFERFGFELTNKNLLPIKVWSDCIGCVNYPNCDEIALIKKLDLPSGAKH